MIAVILRTCIWRLRWSLAGARARYGPRQQTCYTFPFAKECSMRRLIFLLLAVSAFSFSASGQAKHPFTFEDMMKLKRVGEPEVSPDGKWVIFSVVDVDLAANTKTPHIWIVPLSAGQEQRKDGVPDVSPNLRDVGSDEREIIAAQDAARPRSSPDGKRFAFLSTKEGGSQVWIADFDGE